MCVIGYSVTPIDLLVNMEPWEVSEEQKAVNYEPNPVRVDCIITIVLILIGDVDLNTYEYSFWSVKAVIWTIKGTSFANNKTTLYWS